MSTLTLELLQQEIEYASTNDDLPGAFEAYNIVRDWLNRKDLVKSNPREYSQYLEYLMKLKFLTLNYFDDVQEYYELLKNYFALSQEIPGFDLWAKLEAQLVSMNDINERDNFKAKLREALEKSESLLFKRQKYNEAAMPIKVSEWIKDFIVNLGLDRFDKLKKMEYLANGKYVRLLNNEDKDKIKNLLDIYEKLKLSSKLPAGYENTVAMNIDGKRILFSRGEVEEISKETLRQIQDQKAYSSSGDDLFITPSGSAIPTTTLEPPVSDNPIVELEQALKDYPPSSLEHKAISQEISRLKVMEFKAAQQKTNAKK